MSASPSSTHVVVIPSYDTGPLVYDTAVSYTHLTLPTNREV